MFPCHLTILQAKGLLRIASHPKLARGWMDLTEGFQLALAFYDLQMVWRHMCAWQKTQQLENIHHALTFSQANVFSTNVIQLTGLFVLLLYFCHPSGSSVGWSEKHKSLKIQIIQKYKSTGQIHSTDFRTIFGIMIGWFVLREIGQTYFTEREVVLEPCNALISSHCLRIWDWTHIFLILVTRLISEQFLKSWSDHLSLAK